MTKTELKFITGNDAVAPLNEFVSGFLAAMFRASTGVDGGSLGDTYRTSDLAPNVARNLREDCADFMIENLDELKQYAARLSGAPHRVHSVWSNAGHDFWLTRNSCGSGYWDRGLGQLGETLARSARIFGSLHPYTQDNLVYVAGME